MGTNPDYYFHAKREFDNTKDGGKLSIPPADDAGQVMEIKRKIKNKHIK
jgi:hypothetical protein